MSLLMRSGKASSKDITLAFLHRYSSNTLKSTASEVWNYYRGAVAEGEKYRVNTYSTYDAFAVFFLDGTGAVISTIPEEKLSVGQVFDIEVVVPSGAAEMVINEEHTKITATAIKMLRRRVFFFLFASSFLRFKARILSLHS